MNIETDRQTKTDRETDEHRDRQTDRQRKVGVITERENVLI